MAIDVLPTVIDTTSTVLDIQHTITDTQPAMNINLVEWVIDNYHIFWIVEPTLEYDNVNFCFCGYTANSFSYVIDIMTGKIIEDHYGHGGPSYREWLYDSENELFGERIFRWGEEITIHHINQFSTHFVPYINTLNYVRQIDSTSIIREENEWGNISYNKGLKYENSKYAIAYGNILLTEFVYDSPNRLAFQGYKNAIHVSIDGKWGFINTKGNIIIPLIFEHIVSSDGDIAFVKINGKYGIIDVRSSDDR